MVSRGSEHTGIPIDHDFLLFSLLKLLIVTGTYVDFSLVSFDYC